MHATGIISEYNPFHNGHAYHAAKARSLTHSDFIIAVMSGHITQRGEITLLDKWSRALSAVASGVDLVLELPTVFAVRSAQSFAAGGVRLLASLGIVDHLCFGVETLSLSKLKDAAIGMDDCSVIANLKKNMKASGGSYAVALSEALINGGYVSGDCIAGPNNILGIEYMRALKQHAPHMLPLPIHRVGNDYHSTGMSGEISSATAIRKQFDATSCPPQSALAALPVVAQSILSQLIADGQAPTDSARLEAHFLAKLRRMSLAELQTVPECSEGLENRLIRAAAETGNFAEFMRALKTKRYPYSRLQRIVAHVLLGTTKDQLKDFDRSGPLYARVLATNLRGRAALREISKKSPLPLITKTTTFLNSQTLLRRSLSPLQSMLKYDIYATDLFALCLPAPYKRVGGLDFLRSVSTCDSS